MTSPAVPPALDLRRGAPLFVASGLFFAISAIQVRAVSAAASTGQIVLFRFAVGIVGTLAIMAARRERPTVPAPFLLAVRGTIGGTAVLCYFLAIRHLGAGMATLLNYSSPIFATLFAAIFLSERVGPRAIVGLLIATSGAGFVAWGTGAFHGQNATLIGVLAGLASGVLSGGALTSIRALRISTDSRTVYLGFCIFGSLVALPFALMDWRPLDAEAWQWLVAVGLTSLVAQLLMTEAFGFVRAGTGAVMMQLTPVFSALLGFVLLDERFTPVSMFGAALSVGGVLLGTVAGKPLPVMPGGSVRNGT